MENTLLQRVYAISSRGLTGNPALTALASVARRITGDGAPADIAHGITGAIKKLPPEQQEAIVAAVEALAK